MITIENIATYIPEHKMPVHALRDETGLPLGMLRVFESIYGLKFLPIAKNINLIDFLKKPVNVLLSQHQKINDIRYLIYVHTGAYVAPFGLNFLPQLKDEIAPKAIALSMTLYKCVSYFKALELLSVLLRQKNDKAIVLTGEFAYTPLLRVVPRAGLVGDASTATLFSVNGNSHQLLSVHVKYLSGNSKGIYLSEAQCQQFDDLFVDVMVGVIKAALRKASIGLSMIQLVLPHNVNIPVWQKIAVALTLPFTLIFTENISKYAHCFCSDQAINLSSAIKAGRIKKGDYYLMAACGMGFYFAAAVFRF